MIKSLLIVGIGSFLGGVLRYAISMFMKNSIGQTLPWGTMSVNLLGCLIFGIISGLFSKHGSTSNFWCLLLTTGFCGGFTTFSTFTNESVHLLENGYHGSFLAYMATSLAGGLLLTTFGYWITR